MSRVQAHGTVAAVCTGGMVALSAHSPYRERDGVEMEHSYYHTHAMHYFKVKQKCMPTDAAGRDRIQCDLTYISNSTNTPGNVLIHDGIEAVVEVGAG